MSERWPIDRFVGSARELHERAVPSPPRAEVWWLQVEHPAVVLGSTQRSDVVDADRAARRGIEVAHRHSGGGAVAITRSGTTWIDVILPASDLRWTDDVSRSFDWIGRAWVGVLRGLGIDAVAHGGPLVRTSWSDLVCFAGLGPGEVTVDGRKVVGISQRRTRHHARFQCLLLHRWDPMMLIEVLALDPGERATAAVELADVAMGVGPVDPALVVGHLADALTHP